MAAHQVPNLRQERSQGSPPGPDAGAHDPSARAIVLYRFLGCTQCRLDAELALEETRHGEHSAFGRGGENEGSFSNSEPGDPEHLGDPIPRGSSGHAHGDTSPPVGSLQALIDADRDPGLRSALSVGSHRQRFHLAANNHGGETDKGLPTVPRTTRRC